MNFFRKLFGKDDGKEASLDSLKDNESTQALSKKTVSMSFDVPNSTDLPEAFWHSVFQRLIDDRAAMGYPPTEPLSKYLFNDNKVGNLISGMRCNDAKQLEKTNIAEAKIRYELNILDKFDGTMPYDRLRVIYTREGLIKDAIRICDTMINLKTTNSLKVEEEFREKKEKLIKKLPPEARSRKDNSLISIRRIEIPEPEDKTAGKKKMEYLGEFLFVEEISKNVYEKDGFEVIQSENQYWTWIMTLLFWNEIFEHNISGLFNRREEIQNMDIFSDSFKAKYDEVLKLNGAPLDFAEPHFFEFRRGSICAKAEELSKLDKENIKILLCDMYSDKIGTFNRYIEDWNRFDIQDLLKCVDVLPIQSLLDICMRIIRDFAKYRSGLPDLFAYMDRAYRFVEVKSKNDNLSENQIQWIEFITRELKIQVEIFVINHTEKKIEGILNKFN